MKRNISIIIGLAVLICVVVIAGIELGNVSGTSNEQQVAAQKTAIERTAVLCYALEGAYPPKIEYLEDHYGLIVNRDKYIIHYYTYGSNIRPEVEVYPLYSGIGAVYE